LLALSPICETGLVENLITAAIIWQLFSGNFEAQTAGFLAKSWLSRDAKLTFDL
jgi:hypothetical protein